MYIYGKTKVDSVDNLVDIMFFPYRRKIFGKTDKLIKMTKKHRFYKVFPIYQLQKIGDK
jgi:hypothetical protein